MFFSKHVPTLLRASSSSTRRFFAYPSTVSFPARCSSSSSSTGFDVHSDLTSKNYFKVLGIPESFDVDPKHVSERFKSLQREWHPDHHYSGESGTDPDKAAAISSLVNEAYKALKSPHTRAKHLLALLGQDEDPDMSPDFLAWVVQFREAIDDAEGDEETVEKLADQVNGSIEELLSQLRNSFSRGSLEDAASQTAQLKYMWRMRTALEEQ